MLVRFEGDKIGCVEEDFSKWDLSFIRDTLLMQTLQGENECAEWMREREGDLEGTNWEADIDKCLFETKMLRRAKKEKLEQREKVLKE